MSGERRTFVIGVGMTRFCKPGTKEGDYPDWAREAGQAAWSKTASVANDVPSTLVWVARDADTRDNFLLGAAALAIGAAAVVGYRRRES